MKNKLRIVLGIVITIVAVLITFESVYPMDFYSIVFLVWGLTDPEPCGKFMAEQIHMLMQFDYLKSVITDEDEWTELQIKYFDRKQAEIKNSVDRFDCVDIVENDEIISLWPDLQKRALEIWKNETQYTR